MVSGVFHRFSNFMKINKQLSALIISTLFIYSCSNSSAPKQYTKTNKPSTGKFPKVPKRVIPGGISDSWRYLGKSDSGKIAVEINDSSIAKLGNEKYKFTDRKTITNRNGFNFQSFPPHTYDVSEWIMNCSDKQYKITSKSIFDEYGTIIKTYDLSGNYSSIRRNSIIDKEYGYVCKNEGKNIGY
ncbi:MAG: hypothetical protein EKK64_01215 [Neisseriaceae bacterium]|jgi:hypothetical protein|nr:MAG: hypothetical protein EKK64_01215 [Neisseriaceae bacterium]